MEIDLGEYEGQILFTERYGSCYDQQILKFDYIKRNHYNADSYMCRHFYEIITKNAKPEATVEQAFFAEALGYASILSQKEDRQVSVSEIIPDDLKYLFDEKLF
jgi:predicted dehydrogenase